MFVFWFVCIHYIKYDSMLYFLSVFVKNHPAFSFFTFIFTGLLIDKKISDILQK